MVVVRVGADRGRIGRVGELPGAGRADRGRHAVLPGHERAVGPAKPGPGSVADREGFRGKDLTGRRRVHRAGRLPGPPGHFAPAAVRPGRVVRPGPPADYS